MKPHTVYSPSSSSSRTTSQEHLAIVNPNPPKTAASYSVKSSLMHEVETASETKASLAHSRPTSSLASHVSGATFASIARAAELQAARARQELNTRSTNVLVRTGRPNSNVSESMPRKGRAWKRLDLSDATDLDRFPVGKENEHPHTGPSSLANNEDIDDGVQWGFELRTHASKPAEITMMPEQDILAPRPSNVLHDRWSELVSDSPTPSFWDLSSPDPDSEGFGGTAQMPFIRGPSYSTLSVSPGPFYPRSRLPYDTSLEHGQDEEEEEATMMKLSPLLSAQLPPAIYPRLDDFVTNANDFRATAEEALRNTYPFVSRSAVSGFYEAPIGAGIAQLTAKPPHCYPAVKGTRSDLERGSVASSHYEASTLFPADLVTTARGQGEGSADVAIATAEWTIRNDLEPPSRFIPPCKRASTLTEEEDYESWKNRRVPIVNAAVKNARTDDPIVFGMRMTADGVFPVHDNLKPALAPPPPPPAPARKRPNRGWYDLLTDTYRTDGRGEPKAEQQPVKVYSSLFARNTPPAEPTLAENSLAATKRAAQAELARLRAREAGEREALRAANFPDDPPPEETQSPAEGTTDANDVAVALLLPALAQLATYQRGSRHFTQDYFHRLSEAPSWCVDHGPEGNASFFGGDWGTPPARVGRDPRYRLNGRHGPADWSLGGGGGGRRQGRWMR